jgi:rhodanese-related sulfurtransferase
LRLKNVTVTQIDSPLRRQVLTVVGTLCVISVSKPAQAFFWKDPTWPSIKRSVREKYPNQIVISTADLKPLLETSALQTRPVLLDVRSRQEYEDSQLAGALLAESVKAAEAVFAGSNIDKDALIIVYCSVGYRSAVVVDGLVRRGYTNVRNYEGSIFEWANSGYPVYQGRRKVNSVHPYDRSWGTLLKRELWSRDLK